MPTATNPVSNATTSWTHRNSSSVPSISADENSPPRSLTHARAWPASNPATSTVVAPFVAATVSLSPGSSPRS